MKAVILAGGYAKRMWPLTKNKPKHLLPIAGRPLLDYVIERLDPVSEIEEIYLSTNAQFAHHFSSYLENRDFCKKINLVVEETCNEKGKFGSVGALGYLIKENNIGEDTLILGGDNIFSFGIADFLDYFRNKKGNVIALYNLKSLEKAKLYGVVHLDNDNKIKYFYEKPANPCSTLVSTACYILTRKGVRNILKYLDSGNDPDKIGHFIEWLYKNDEVYGFVFKGIWFDVGSVDVYKEANEYFSQLA